MAPHGVVADHQHLGDLVIRPASRNKREDLGFARGETARPRRWRRVGERRQAGQVNTLGPRRFEEVGGIERWFLADGM